MSIKTVQKKHHHVPEGTAMVIETHTLNVHVACEFRGISRKSKSVLQPWSIIMYTQLLGLLNNKCFSSFEGDSLEKGTKHFRNQTICFFQPLFGSMISMGEIQDGCTMIKVY